MRGLAPTTYLAAFHVGKMRILDVHQISDSVCPSGSVIFGGCASEAGGLVHQERGISAKSTAPEAWVTDM